MQAQALIFICCLLPGQADTPAVRTNSNPIVDQIVPKEDITIWWVEAAQGMTVVLKTESGLWIERRKMYIGDGTIAVPLESNDNGIWLQKTRRFYQNDKLLNGRLIKVRSGYKKVSQLKLADYYVVLGGVTFVEPGMLHAEWSGTDDAGRRISMSFGADKTVTFSIGEEVVKGTYEVAWYKTGICHLDLNLGQRGKLTTIMQPSRERLLVELNKPGETRPVEFTSKAVVLSRKAKVRNDSHAQETGTEVTPFAEDVVFHVVLHEVGHGLIREFDLPILGNEDTMADAFATHYLTHFLPDRAFDVLDARISSLMFEANEVPREKWSVTGEHNNNARRAHQIAALAVAADPEKYSPLAKKLGMTGAEINKAKDYGSEIHRSWRRILRPLMMPRGIRSKEARVRFDPSNELLKQLRSGRLVSEIESSLTRFDWHSQVTVFFVQGDGGAGWSRSKRTITVHTEYIRRFIRQGASRQQK